MQVSLLFLTTTKISSLQVLDSEQIHYSSSSLANLESNMQAEGSGLSHKPIHIKMRKNQVLFVMADIS